jgi:hypothetical protein
VDVHAIPQEMHSLLISFLVFIVFGEGKFLNFDDLVLKVEEELGLKYQEVSLLDVILVIINWLIVIETQPK